MHFYQSRGIPKLVQGAIKRHYIGKKNVNTFVNLSHNEEQILKNRKDDKKYLYQIPPWLKKSQKQVETKNELQNEIIVKENKCKSVYKINRRVSPVPKIREKFEYKEETPKPKLTPHFSPNAITLDSPLKNLHKKNLKIPGKEDPFQLTPEPYQFSDPVFNRKSNMKKKTKNLLDTLVQKKIEEKKMIDKKETERKEGKKMMDKKETERKECKKMMDKKETERKECKKMMDIKETERKECKKMEKVVAKIDEKEKMNVEKKIELKKRVVIPKSFDHMCGKSVEDKKKMWKDIIESLEFHDVTRKSKIETCSRNKLIDYPNRPVKLSSKEMLYSKGVEKKILKKIEKPTQVKIEKIQTQVKIESPKIEKSISASTSIKNLREKKSQAFQESVIILRKEGERLRKEYERTRNKSKQALDRVRAIGKSRTKLDKNETTEYIKDKFDYQKNDQKMESKNEKKSQKIKTVSPQCLNPSINAKPIIKEALVNRISSKIIPNIEPKLPNMNINKYMDSKDKKDEHIPARLILPKYPNSTVFDNKFTREPQNQPLPHHQLPPQLPQHQPQPQPQPRNEESKDPKDTTQAKGVDFKKTIQVQAENNENIVKINDLKDINDEPETVYCLPMGLVKAKDVKICKKESGIDSLQELLNTEPKSDFNRLPKEIKDALIRIGKPNLDQFIIPHTRSTNMDLNLKKALVNFQVDQAQLSPGLIKKDQKLIPENSIQSECDFSKFGTKFSNKKPKCCKKIKKISKSELIPVKEPDEIVQQSKPIGLPLLIHSKIQDLFSKYKCYFHTTIRTLDMNRKIKLEKEKNSILPYGGGNVLNKIRSQPKKTLMNLKPPKKISKGPIKPKVLRNGKYRKSLYNKSNNYYIKIKTKPAKKKTVNIDESVHDYLEPMPGLAKKTIPPPPAMAYSEVLSAIYTKKGAYKYA